MKEQILSELQALIEKDVENFSDDMGKTKTAVKELMTSLGNGVLQQLVDRGPKAYKGSSIICQCPSMMKFVQHRKGNIQTIFGWITVKRAYYHCTNCGKGLASYDRDSGLGNKQLSLGPVKGLLFTCRR
jgi:hypothetical protein